MPLADSTRFCIKKPFVLYPAKACVASGIVGVNARASGKDATTRCREGPREEKSALLLFFYEN